MSIENDNTSIITDEGVHHKYATLIPEAAFEVGLTAMQFHVYSHCQRLLQEGCAELPSNREIAKACNISSASVSHSRRALAAKGLLEYERALPTSMPGHVYLIECNGLHKIGMSKSLAARLEHIRGYMPWPVAVVCTVPAGDALGLERALHRFVGRCRVKGDWFNLAPQDVKRVVSRMQAVQR